MIGLLLALSMPAVFSPQAAPPGPTPQATAVARPDDVKSMDAIVAALYDVISGPAGQKRDWDRMKSLFVPGGRLIPSVPSASGGATARVLDVDGYIGRAQATLERDGFFEREISRRTESFGHIAQIFSTYESRHAAADDKPFARGINSIQLLKDGDRWWIVTVFWDAERPGQPIPSDYLPRK